MSFEIVRVRETEQKLMDYWFDRTENFYKIFFVVGTLMFALGLIV
jgi:hypothetical protein